MKKCGIGKLLLVTLLMNIIFLPVVSAESNSTVPDNNGTETYTVGNAEVILDKYENLSGANLMVTANDSTYNYTISVDKLDDTYMAQTYDDEGNLVKTESYSSNPLISSNGDEPAIVTKGSIVVDASVDIYPDKYSYTKGSYGTINLNIDNSVLPDLGIVNYYLRIPLPVKYVSVYSGKKPTAVYNLPTKKSFVAIPKKGVVFGPATVVYWTDYHSFGYKKNMKVKVQYPSKGTFNIYAYDHEFESAIGIPAWDDDNFDVKVS